MKDYINIKDVVKASFSICKEQVENFGDDFAKELVSNNFDDDTIMEYAEKTAEKVNSEMCEYLHKKDTHIIGNFNDIHLDYPENSGASFDEMLARLDAGEQSAKTISDKNFLTEWFWKTFGTHNIAYNFVEFLNEELYSLEKEII